MKPQLSHVLSALKKSSGMAGSESVRLAAIGDSVTAGWLEHGILDADAAYPSRFRTRLSGLYPNAMISMVNAGLGGEGTEGALSRLDRDVLAFRPHLVLVCLCLNDTRRGREYLAEFSQNLTYIVSRCRESGADVILLTPNPRVETESEIGIVLEFVRAVRSVARATDTPISDVHAVYQGAVRMGAALPDLLSNRVSHPTREGHEIFVNALMAHFQMG